MDIVMRPLLKVLAIAIGMCAVSAQADTHQNGKINRLIVEDNKFVSIWMDTTVSGDCPSDGRWAIDLTNDPAAKEKYSAALMAYALGKTVGLHHLTANGCGGWGSKKIYYIDLSG